jgi:hypothetical protein
LLRLDRFFAEFFLWDCGAVLATLLFEVAAALPAVRTPDFVTPGCLDAVLAAVRFKAGLAFDARFAEAFDAVLREVSDVLLELLLLAAFEPVFFEPAVFAVPCPRPLVPRRDELIFFAALAITQPSLSTPRGEPRGEP